jgi:hypothetical protein
MAWPEALAKVHRLLPRPSMPPQPAALHSLIGAVVPQAAFEDRSGRTVEPERSQLSFQRRVSWIVLLLKSRSPSLPA